MRRQLSLYSRFGTEDVYVRILCISYDHPGAHTGNAWIDCDVDA